MDAATKPQNATRDVVMTKACKALGAIATQRQRTFKTTDEALSAAYWYLSGLMDAGKIGANERSILYQDFCKGIGL